MRGVFGQSMSACKMATQPWDSITHGDTGTQGKLESIKFPCSLCSPWFLSRCTNLCSDLEASAAPHVGKTAAETGINLISRTQVSEKDFRACASVFTACKPARQEQAWLVSPAIAREYCVGRQSADVIGRMF